MVSTYGFLEVIFRDDYCGCLSKTGDFDPCSAQSLFMRHFLIRICLLFFPVFEGSTFAKQSSTYHLAYTDNPLLVHIRQQSKEVIERAEPLCTERLAVSNMFFILLARARAEIASLRRSPVFRNIDSGKTGLIADTGFPKLMAYP